MVVIIQIDALPLPVHKGLETAIYFQFSLFHFLSFNEKLIKALEWIKFLTIPFSLSERKQYCSPENGNIYSEFHFHPVLESNTVALQIVVFLTTIPVARSKPHFLTPPLWSK
jgi:hypothetical protein